MPIWSSFSCTNINLFIRTMLPRKLTFTVFILPVQFCRIVPLCAMRSGVAAVRANAVDKTLR